MKNYVVTYTIKDGEYEYLQQSLVRATSETDAREVVSKEINDWIQGDYREFEIDRIEKLNSKEFEVIKKYIY